jgi:hypothetical protein
MARKIKYAGQLGKKIVFPANTGVQLNQEGFKQEWAVKTISIIIGIGRDNTAELIMDLEAWEALKSGQEIFM